MTWFRRTIEALKVSAIDLNKLKQYEGYPGAGTRSLIETMLDLYLERAPKVYFSLEQAFNFQDTQALCHATQTLKSISANMGAVKLAKICQSLERKTYFEEAADDWSREQLAQLSVEYKAVIDELKVIREAIKSFPRSEF